MSRLGQKELAKRLGLSQATISAVLNDNRSIKISEATRQRVLDEAARVNYWPNRAASALLSRKTKTIAIVHVGNYLQTHMQKLAYAATAVERAGYTPIIQELIPGVKDDYICQYLRDGGVDGLVIVYGTHSFMQKGFPKYLQGHIPTVALDQSEYPFLARFNSNRRQGFAMLTQHLIRQGHRKIALFCSMPPELEDLSLTHSFGVEQGSLDALRAEGLEPSAILRHKYTVQDRRDPYRAGNLLMRSLLDSGKRPDAVVCSNDAWAIGAMAECMRRGMRLPEDMALTGFHNEVQAQYAPCPLTTAQAPLEQMISRAVKYLTDWLQCKDDPKIPSSLTLMDCELVIRASCGAPPAGS